MAMALDSSAKAQSLAGMVSALGTATFEEETLSFLNTTSGAEHYCVYRLRDNRPEFLGGASTRGRHALRHRLAQRRWTDRTFVELRDASAAASVSPKALMVHDAITDVVDPALYGALRHFRIADRVMVCGQVANDFYAVSVMRSHDIGQFDERELGDLSTSADVLVAACAKHADLHWDRDRTTAHFASVTTIEANLRPQSWGLSKRELQVGARILYGISAYGISVDLGLSEDTVATYRKRLYARLGIGGRHELLQRYLALF
jgi:DNA-binding CsgD family transcriptional regulator